MNKMSDDIIIFLLVTTTIILVMAGFVITIVLLYRKKQISHQKNIDYIKAEFEKAILNTQLEIQEQTFKNISTEIHDNIGMSLTLAKLNLNTLPPEDMTMASRQVNNSVELISKAITDLADISKSLNADFIAENGLMHALEQEINKLKVTGVYEIIFEVNGETTFLNAQKELVIFRIVQEALNNIIKHARARQIVLRLDYRQNQLDLMISDDGIGIRAHAAQQMGGKRTGAGLINMKQRALMLGGSWAMESRETGTWINVTVPY